MKPVLKIKFIARQDAGSHSPSRNADEFVEEFQPYSTRGEDYRQSAENDSLPGQAHEIRWTSLKPGIRPLLFLSLENVADLREQDLLI